MSATSIVYISPYLNFDGDCRAAFTFYAEHLNGEIEAMLTHADVPGGEAAPPEWKDRIMHASMRIGGVAILASDSPIDGHEPARGFHISLTVATPEEAERIFDGLAEGGTVEMPLEQTFWSPRFGMVVDRFGTPWMISADQPEAPQGE